MKFKNFLEMAIMKGDYDSDTFSHENDWEYDYSPSEDNDTKLLAQNSKGYKLYKTEYIMFMTTKTDEYLGSIEYEQNGKTISVETAHSTLKGGFYLNLFELLFKKFKEIKSDHVLSKNAFKAYSKLASKYTVKVISKDNTEFELTSDNLFVATDGTEFDSRKHSQEKYFRTISVTK